ncbi:MAG: TOBE domain-containing protein [Phycisphaerales bacterium]|nr:MAG: TOBE domain-containing protein [Phycisphaerales bacterium]
MPESDYCAVCGQLTDMEPTVATKEHHVKHGARNKVTGTVRSIKSGDVMSLVKFDVTEPGVMSSVLTTESVEALDLKVGDEVQLVIKAIHVLPVKG